MDRNSPTNYKHFRCIFFSLGSAYVVFLLPNLLSIEFSNFRTCTTYALNTTLQVTCSVAAVRIESQWLLRGETLPCRDASNSSGPSAVFPTKIKWKWRLKFHRPLVARCWHSVQITAMGKMWSCVTVASDPPSLPNPPKANDRKMSSGCDKSQRCFS